MGKDTDENSTVVPVPLYFTSCSTMENHFYEKPPIILMSGLFSTNTTWNRVKCQISNWTGRRVFSVDLRNHGKSGYSEVFDIKHMVADLELMMKEQNINKAILIGHSCGGRVVAQLALQKPEMVEKLIAEDIIISDDKHPDARAKLVTLCKNMYKYITKLPPTLPEADASKLINNVVSKVLPQFSTNGKHFDIGQALPFYKDEKTGDFKFTCNMPAVIELLENPAKAAFDLTSDPVYPGKTLFIAGEHTILNIEEEQELALKYFPNSQFQTIKNSNHVSHSENPEDFVRIVSDFILDK